MDENIFNKICGIINTIFEHIIVSYDTIFIDRGSRSCYYLLNKTRGGNMAVYPEGEVVQFIFDIRAKLMLDKLNNLYIVPRADRKNQLCMLNLGLRHNDVADILSQLETENYSETVDDTDRPGKYLWVFGFIYDGNELYIKISLREKVVCVSFHIKEHVITYPYR